MILEATHGLEFEEVGTPASATACRVKSVAHHKGCTTTGGVLKAGDFVLVVRRVVKGILQTVSRDKTSPSQLVKGSKLTYPLGLTVLPCTELLLKTTEVCGFPCPSLNWG